MTFKKEEIISSYLKEYEKNPANAIFPSVDSNNTEGRYGVMGTGRNVKQRTNYVYFIRAMESGNIKIGYTYDPADRLKDLQVGSSEELKYMFVVPVSCEEVAKSLEYEFHTKFAHLNIRGEWFEPDKELIEFVEKAELLSKVVDSKDFKEENSTRVKKEKTWLCGHKRENWQSACSKCLLSK